MKKLIFCILFIMAKNFLFAVVNTHPPGSAAWHNYNNMLWGQLEYDRQQRERAAAQQRQAQPQQYVEPDIYIIRSVFVWNDETGKAYYLPCFSEEKGWFAKGKVVKRAQKIFTEIHGEKPNRYIDWECSFAVITMGISKKTGKIEAYVDADLKAWIKKYGENNPDFVKLVNQGALDYCSTQADNCQLIYGVGDFGEEKNN